MLSRVDERAPGIDLPLMSVSQTRGVLRRSELTDKPPRAESLDVYKICRTGDIVFNKMSIRAGALGVAREDGLVTYHYEVMRPLDGADARFIVYLVKSSWFVAQLIERERGIGAGDQGGGVRTTEVPFSVLRTIDAFLPPRAHQSAIADYLDRETAQIDALIEKQQQLISNLRERRDAVLRAEIYGTDQPSGWRLTPIRRGFTVTLGKMLDAGRDLKSGDIDMPYIRAANVQDRGLELRDINYMPFSKLEARQLDLRRGDLLVVEGGAVGTCHVLSEDMPGWSFQKTVNRVRSRGLDSTAFLALAIRICRDSGFIDVLCNRSTIPHLTAEKLSAMEVPLPDALEQYRVVQLAQRLSAKIDLLVSDALRLIELSRERRSALITAAVTGQIDVRSAA